MLKLFLLFFLFGASFYAQDKNIELEWLENQSINEIGNYTEVPLAKDIDFQIEESGVFNFAISWKVNSVSYMGGDIYEVLSEDIDKSKLVNIDITKIPTTISWEVTSSLARGVRFETLKFTPIIYKSGVYKKVTSFKLKSQDNVVRVNNSNFSGKSLKSLEVSSSVLATGEWFKFKIDTTGVYKITPQFLSSLGMDLNNVDPNTIKIYGNGGESLPLANSENDIFDIPENPIKIVGAEDGVFAGDDFILFYGRGSKGFVAENRSHINPYEDDTYYFVTSGGAIGKKVTDTQEPVGLVDQVFESYDYYTFVEKDLFNLGQLGRIWHGDKFDGFTNERNYELPFPELTSDAQLDVNVVFSGIYGSPPSLGIQISDALSVKSNSTINFTTLNTDNNAFQNRSLLSSIEQTSIVNSSGATVLNVNGDRLFVNLNYSRGADASSEGYLDYMSLSTQCVLKGIGEQFGFSNSETISANGIGQFIVTDASDLISIWDVTDPYNINEKENNSLSEITVNFSLGNLKSYVAIDEDDLFEPEEVSNSRIFNQDLKGTVFQNGSNQFEDVDYLVLANSDFMNAASQLASFRTQNDGYNVKVVDIQSIYNEFSTGKQDVAAIRNFVKYIFDNASNEEERLKYICIIGDGSYDYKERLIDNTNHVPLYHAIESSSLTSGYSTDDFYCLMDENEGGNPTIDKMDISIGRILARTPAEAITMVDKIKSFYSREAYGDWRNSVLFVSDDVDLESDSAIQDKIIEISDDLDNQVERVNIRRILTDSYVQRTTSGGERYDEARDDLEETFDLGVSYINYFGHGGEDGITGEFIFSAESAQNLRNQERLPVFVTLTCELTRFDNPNRLTAGEFLYWNPIGGAVALVSTTRNLFLSVGLSLNNSLADALFDEEGTVVPIGDAIRFAKNTLSTSNKRTVYCIGDPAIKMALPKTQINLTEVNGVSLENWNATGEPLKALDNVSLKGEVVNGVTGQGLSGFNGEVTVSVFDKDIVTQTLGNDGVRSDGELIIVDFVESGGLVFKGLASVNNGEFTIDFVLPKNVQLDEGEGKISFYATNNTELEDRSGANKILIGSLNTNVAEDVTPPVIDLFLNDETFFSGQLVGSSPSIFAKLSDENGINTAGGVGHDIVAILDGDETSPIILNEYYNTNIDDFTSGQLTFALNDLDPGEHILELRASDTHNNSSLKEISFLVGESSDFSLVNVLNYPNPFVSYTEFWFSHTSIPNDTLEVTVQVLTITGKIVTTKFATLSGDTTYRGGVKWDGRDDFGNKIGKGVYVYKIIAKSTLTNKTTSKFQKLVLL